MACLKNQTMNKVFTELNWTLDYMMENDIKLVQFSATPDGLLFALNHSKWPQENYSVHTMQTGNGYYGAKEMMERGKIRQYKDICGMSRNGEQYVEDMEDIYDNIEETLRDILSFEEPKYNIYRVRGGSEQFVKNNIQHTPKTTCFK